MAETKDIAADIDAVKNPGETRLDAVEQKVHIDWQKIDAIINRYNSGHEALLMIMQDISDIYNYVPPEVIPVLGNRLGIKKSLIYSVATFYKTISLEPRGKYIINVCTGTACHVRGADRIMDALQEKLKIKEGQTTEDLRFSLEAVRCVGCCASGPVITVNQETHGGLDRSRALKVIEEYEKKIS
ncbi:MAG: NAD(P)H-dependent oxidoreductase subunit E [Deltaproteobacteria bacterium]|nr:NAD(P)H-dependent oxidoreductase subunit E [Deltaproteobacteria bacterium]